MGMGLQDVILGRSSEIGLISLAGWSDTCEDVAGVLFYLDSSKPARLEMSESYSSLNRVARWSRCSTLTTFYRLVQQQRHLTAILQCRIFVSKLFYHQILETYSASHHPSFIFSRV